MRLLNSCLSQYSGDINSSIYDSSNTLIDVETRNSDTSISYKSNEYIINSIRIK